MVMTMNEVEHMMDTISRICSEPRDCGSSGAHATREHLCDALVELGFTPTLQKSAVRRWRQARDPEVYVIDSEARYAALPAILSASTGAEGVEGSIRKLEPFLMLGCFPWDRLGVFNESGMLVASIISSERDVRVQPLPGGELSPCVIVERGAFLNLQEMSEQNPATRVSVTSITEWKEEYPLTNIVTEYIGDGRRILLCAHYDSTFNSVGALDNASGVAVVLELARVIKNQKLPVQIAFFDGEEINHAGSSRYVESLPAIDLGKLALVLEVDTVGAGREISCLCSKRAYKLLNESLFRAIDELSDFKIDISAQSRIPFCDVWPFMEKKVPVVRMLTRAERGSGRGHDVIHSARDTIDQVDPKTMIASYQAAACIINAFQSQLSM